MNITSKIMSHLRRMAFVGLAEYLITEFHSYKKEYLIIIYKSIWNYTQRMDGRFKFQEI